ncbi:MAG: oligopeptide ABC transporter ATP-binding protein [Nitrosopumilales archaeon]|nr:oligopeptide ABC transporter ATP-binding protein [Nitrosopumilales archaeon]
MNEVLKVDNLSKTFTKKNFFGSKTSTVRAVEGVTFTLHDNETLVIAGESGSGKTTIAKLILGAIRPDSGKIIFDGNEITDNDVSLRKIRMHCQMVHQDPYDSINPRMRVIDIISEPLEIHNIGNDSERKKIVLDAIREVKLEPAEEIAHKFPHMLSGGQRQRVILARALVLRPKVIIADEPVSMLDVSIRAEILALMKQIQENNSISFIYITHDLVTAKYFGQKMIILYLGKIMEEGTINEILANPKHPYTQALIDAIPEPDPDNLYKERKIRINDPTNVDVYSGCRFRARCPYVIEKCKDVPPLLEKNDRRFACFVDIN